MAKLNLEYYDGNNYYSDGPIEEYLLQYVKGEPVEMSNLSLQDRYAMFYHLSPLRTNILSWYPFHKDSSILEIGSGCGAITGLLCQKACQVTCVELSYRRSEVNLERNKNKDNLEIYVGNLNNIQIPELYDYIVINGVLEYANGFTNSENPYEDFLKNVHRYLKPTGTLLLAIENRLGIKYFSGSSEDHTDNYFLGLNQYKGNSTIRTFSKTELLFLLESSGFKNNIFYYPYPDYKFPVEIFSEDTINNGQYGRRIFSYEKERIKLYDEKKVMDTFSSEKIMDKFANSFLVEAHKTNDIPNQQIYYAKLNTTRKSKFRISTVIFEKSGKKFVAKSAQTAEAEVHLNNLNKYEKNSCECGNYLQGTWIENKLVYPFINSKSLDAEILEYIHLKDSKSIKKLIHSLFDSLISNSNYGKMIYSKEFKDFFGETEIDRNFNLLKEQNIDLICDNVYRKNDSYLFIDREWVCGFAVPAEFIIWRLINELFNKYNELYDFIKLNGFYSEFNIDEECCAVFQKWAVHFAEEYVSDHNPIAFHGNVYPLSLDEWIRNYKLTNQFSTVLYMDTGKGYNEEEKVTASALLSGHTFSVQFILPKQLNLKALRWDPIENAACRCEITECRINKKSISFHSVNNSDGDETLFLTLDPQVEILIDSLLPCQTLTIKGEIEFLDAKKILNYYVESKEQLESKIFYYNTELQKRSDLLKEIKRNLIVIHAANESYRNENYSLIDTIELLKKENILLQENSQKLELEVADLKEKINNIQTNICIQAKVDNDNTSFSEKVIKFFKGRE